MPYVGNEPTSNFVSVTKDLFSGDGSTVAFTLSKASTTNGVAVFVENVRQEPTIAYAVSGTTLTFTAAPVTSSGNNIYVLHHNAPASTANHPAAQSLTAVNGTFTGNIDVDGTTDLDGLTSSTDVKLLKGDSSAISQYFQNSSTGSSATNGVQVALGSGEDFQIWNYSNTDFTLATNNTERFKVKNDGDVIIASSTGIGGVTPTNLLTVSAGVNSYVSRFNNTVGSGNVFMHLWRMTTAPDDTTSMFLVCDDGDGTTSRMKINSEGDILTHDGSAVASLSDERIKQDITDANSQWDDIKAIKVRNFKRKDDVRQYGDKAKVQLGVIAQEIEKTSPKLVKENPPDVGDILSSDEFGTLEDDTDSPIYYEDGDTIPNGKKVGDVKGYNKKVKEQKTTVKSVIYSILYMKAIKALQEAMTRIETLEAKVKALEDA